jgi:hypothetical protein
MQQLDLLAEPLSGGFFYLLACLFVSTPICCTAWLALGKDAVPCCNIVESLYADKLFEKASLPSAGSWAKQPLHS